MNTTVRLRRRHVEHRIRRRDDALEEARVQLAHVAADDDDEIGAVARLGERRRDPAGALQDPEIAVLALAQGVIDHAAGPVGERHHGAHALDIGAEAAEHGIVGLPISVAASLTASARVTSLPLT